jgi:glycosyltransferase involved in cell wall biosynthesis
MRIVIDAAPLLGQRTGAGRYVEQLLAALPGAVERSGVDVELNAYSGALRGTSLADLPPEIQQTGRRFPAQALWWAWARANRPQIETLVGACDVFHGTNFVSPPTRRAKEVVTIHDLTYELLTETIAPDVLRLRGLVTRALDRGAHVITPSETARTTVLDFYRLPPERVTATRLGVNRAWFLAEPATPTWLTNQHLPQDYIIFVGGLDPRKNLPRLIAAHAALRAEDPNTPDLVLAGPAGRETGLEGPGVHRTGFLADEALRSLVAGARALALPSLDEGFGLPILEALACGRPVLTADLPVLTEVAGPHANPGDPHDVDSLAAALAATLAEPDDLEQRQARQAWAGKFTWEACADATLAVYIK